MDSSGATFRMPTRNPLLLVTLVYSWWYSGKVIPQSQRMIFIILLWYAFTGIMLKLQLSTKPLRLRDSRITWRIYPS